MKIGLIALRLREANTRFENRVAGVAELARAYDHTLQQNMAFVLPLGESAAPNAYDSGINQMLTERFGVIVAVRTDVTEGDKLGLSAYDMLHDVRTELFGALLGWEPDGADSKVYYKGGVLLSITRATLWYQFEFEYAVRLTDTDGVDSEFDSLGWLNTIYTQYRMTPAAEIPYRGGLPVPASLWTPDMTQIIDLTDDPRAGGFARGFSSGFDWYPKE